MIPNISSNYLCVTLSHRQILDSSKLEEFADENFKFGKNSRKFFKWLESIVGKGEIARYFSRSVFKGLILHTRKNQGLFGKGLNNQQ